MGFVPPKKISHGGPGCRNVWHFLCSEETVVLELGLQGLQAHSQKFWFVTNLCKISKYFGKEASEFYNIIN